MKKTVFLPIFFYFFVSQMIAGAQQKDLINRIFWQTRNENAIVWNVSQEQNLPHDDNIEMSGENVAAIIKYEIDNTKKVRITRDVIFPQLRIFIKPYDSKWKKYRAYLRGRYSDDILPVIVSDQKRLEPGQVDSVRIEGVLRFFHKEYGGLKIVRTFLPSMTERLFVEKWEIKNVSDKPKNISIGKTELIKSQEGIKGNYRIKIYSDAKDKITLKPGRKYEFGIYFSAYLNNEPEIKQTFYGAEKERQNFLNDIHENLVLITPDPVLNTLFYFSKIRAAESIYKTKMGLVHSPGGGRYYAGVWANDQCEYSGPFFPYLGYKKGNTAALNAYLMFKRNIPSKGGHFWSSFEMEGDLTCCGADRGDAAMIAFGASQFALAKGDVKIAEDLWPLIKWSLDYCDSRKNEQGVINSDTDEMEGRISTGGANLATSSLYYGALVNSANLAHALNKGDDVVNKLINQAEDLKNAIENYFGADIEGLKTYRYFKGHQYLRHWICLPLVMGINNRKEGTLEALFTKLWTPNGIKVEFNPNLKEPDLFWDRGTLYAFRGAFKAGAKDRALEKLKSYSRVRLLGFHVPYVVEAWPEGNMAHLSAESALFCRIFTEGLLGIVPTGFKSFYMIPRLPSEWDQYRLEHIRALNSDFDVLIKRKGDKIHIKVKEYGNIIFDETVSEGQKIDIVLKGQNL